MQQLSPSESNIIAPKNVGFEKRGLLEKGSFQKSPFSRDSREFRDSRDLENPQTVENKGESDNFLEILERDFRDSRDSSREKTPFIMTPFSGPKNVSFIKSFKADISPRGYRSKCLLENRGAFGGLPSDTKLLLTKNYSEIIFSKKLRISRVIP